MALIRTPIEIITAPKRYAPIGHCIYCGVYSNNLTKEHIIAHGLAGDSLILPKSSCRSCADKTRDWETICLRHLWWPIRIRIGAPSSGKQAPKEFLLRKMKVTKIHPDGFLDYDKVAEIPVGPMEYPFVFMSYKFPQPAILVGRDPLTEVNLEVVARVSEEEFKKFAPNDKDGFSLAPLDANAYCRMLAKIARSYAVAELGETAFRPVLREIIRGAPFPTLTPLMQWIGGDETVTAAESHLHSIQWRIQTEGGIAYVVVSLRLFSFLASPLYHIVVGELLRPLDQLSLLQQPVYTIDIKAPVPIAELVPANGVTGGTGA